MPFNVAVALIKSLLGAQSAEERYALVLRGAAELVGGVDFALILVRGQGGTYTLGGALGLEPPLHGLGEVPEERLRSRLASYDDGWELAEPFVARGESGHPLLEAQAPEDGVLLGRLMEVGPAHASLTLPLAVHGEVWAVLGLHSRGRAAFDGADVAAVLDYAARVSPIAREAHLRASAERQALWLRAINAVLHAPRERALDAVLAEALQSAVRLSGADGARLVAVRGGGPEVLAAAGRGADLAIEGALSGEVLDRLVALEPVSLPRYDRWPEARPDLVEAGLRSLAAFPPSRREVETGALLVYSLGHHWAPDGQTLELLADMASAIGMAQFEQQLLDELSWAAYADHLTGLYNRRAFERDLEELPLLPRGRSAALLLLDLDGFKEINDLYGHVHADTVLRRLGGALRAKARSSDRWYRLGGDEFAALIEGPTVENLSIIAERYRGLVNEIGVAEDRRLRGSLGFAVYPRDALDVTDLWRAADAALYRDKAARKAGTTTTGREPASSGPSHSPADASPAGNAARVALALGRSMGLHPDELKALRMIEALLELRGGNGLKEP